MKSVTYPSVQQSATDASPSFPLPITKMTRHWTLKNVGHFINKKLFSSLIACEYPQSSSGSCWSISGSSRRSCCGPQSDVCFLSQTAGPAALWLFLGYQSEKLSLLTSTGFPAKKNVDNLKAIRQLLKSV